MLGRSAAFTAGEAFITAVIVLVSSTATATEKLKFSLMIHARKFLVMQGNEGLFALDAFFLLNLLLMKILHYIFP